MRTVLTALPLSDETLAAARQYLEAWAQDPDDLTLMLDALGIELQLGGAE
ncbi:hypothetical protein [Kitasatospora sp. NPDC087314]